jgi:hypothetical protein
VTSENGQKKTEATHETVIDSEADKIRTETTPSETPRTANTLTEPEAQEPSKRPERADEVAGPPTMLPMSTLVAIIVCQLEGNIEL